MYIQIQSLSSPSSPKIPIPTRSILFSGHQLYPTRLAPWEQPSAACVSMQLGGPRSGDSNASLFQIGIFNGKANQHQSYLESSKILEILVSTRNPQPTLLTQQYRVCLVRPFYNDVPCILVFGNVHCRM